MVTFCSTAADRSVDMLTASYTLEPMAWTIASAIKQFVLPKGEIGDNAPPPNAKNPPSPDIKEGDIFALLGSPPTENIVGVFLSQIGGPPSLNERVKG